MLSFKIMDVLTAIESIVAEGCLSDGRGRTGGCLVAIEYGEKPLFTLPIGEVSDIKTQSNYWVNAQEKTCRVDVNHNDITAWQTRDFDGKKYGGAIRATDGNVYGFSGLSEHWDECVSCAVAYVVNPESMPEERLRAIAEISKNPHLVTFCLKHR